MSTSAELEMEMCKKLGNINGKVFYKIYNDFFWLLYKWNEYLELFGKSHKRIELLNESTSMFFYMIQSTLVSDIVISISRLTDPIKTGKNRNLTFMLIPEMIADKEVKEALNNKLADINNEMKTVRNSRNEKYAHSDFETNMNGKPTLLYEPSIQTVIDKLYDVLKYVYEEIFDSYLVKEIIAPYTGAVTLMTLLREGINFRKRVYKEVDQGNYRSIDEIDRNPI